MFILVPFKFKNAYLLFRNSREESESLPE